MKTTLSEWVKLLTSLRAFSERSRESDLTYSPIAVPVLEGAFGTIQNAVDGQNRVSEKAIEGHERAIDAIRATLSTDAPPEERARARDQIMQVDEKIDQEAEKARRFNRDVILLFAKAGAAVLVVSAVLFARRSPATSRSLFEQAWGLLKAPFA